MGRYYFSKGTKFEFEGKFGMALQDSDAPKKFGMEEQVVLYQTEDESAVLSQITKIFEALNVPAGLRQTDFDNDQAVFAYVESIEKPFKDYNLGGPEKEDEITYFDSTAGKEYRYKRIHAELICDLLLGVRIYNAVRLNGECTLEAEF